MLQKKKEQHIIHMLILDVSTQKLSTVFGHTLPPKRISKELFWQHLLDLNPIRDTSWCLISDFVELEMLLTKGGLSHHLISVSVTSIILVVNSRHNHSGSR